jgi:hypothetical protein
MLRTSFAFLSALTLSVFWSGALPALGQSGTDGQDSLTVATAAGAPASSDPSASALTATATMAKPAAAAFNPSLSVGIVAKISSLGVGVDAATPLTARTNLRVGFNALGYSDTFHADGIGYNTSLTLRSLDALLDWYPFKGGFHITPGVMLYNGNQAKAAVLVPGKDTFTLNGVSYESDPITPVTGTGKLTFSPAAPMVLVGWGNVVQRTKRFSIPVEIGAVFGGAPKMILNLAGNVCEVGTTRCGAISSDPTAHSNIQAEESKLNKDLNPLRYYPVISVGFAYRFSIGSRAEH